MEIRELTKNDTASVKALYEAIKKKTFTLWDKDYPSTELINWDIERNGLFGVFENSSLIAVCYAGARCEDNEEGFTWKENFKSRATFARLGVAPEWQNKGVATYFLSFIINHLKQNDFDGIRILVGKENKNAIGLYKKFNFREAGAVHRMNTDYLLMELRIN